MKKANYLYGLIILVLLSGCYKLMPPPVEITSDDPSYNHGKPTSPFPADGAINVKTIDLSWNYDVLNNYNTTYDIYFGRYEEPDLEASNITEKNYTISIDSDETYYWKVVAKDQTGSYESDTWTFTTVNNLPPYIPSVPNPENNSTNSYVSYLSWDYGLDPDHDNVTYSLYFGTTENPPLFATNLESASNFDVIIEDFIVYYWKIIAYDGNGNSTEGPVWSFIVYD